MIINKYGKISSVGEDVTLQNLSGTAGESLT